MKKLAVFLGMALALTLAGCDLMGNDGLIYGSFNYASGSSVTGVLGGFPEGAIYPNTYYSIAPGTYSLYYRIYYDGYYYPGNAGDVGYGSSDSSYWWFGTYTVTANPGEAFFTDGEDKAFGLYLNRNYGLALGFGDVAIGGTYASRSPGASAMDVGPGSSSWTSKRGDLTVAVTSKIVKLSEAEAAALPTQTFVKIH